MEKTNSKILTLILSFIVGIIGMIFMFFILYIGIFGNSLIFSYLIDFGVFFFIGMFVSRLFSKKFLDINSYFTIPFIIPIIWGRTFMLFFETGGVSFFELFPLYIAVFVPLVSYLTGLVYGKKKLSYIDLLIQSLTE